MNQFYKVYESETIYKELDLDLLDVMNAAPESVELSDILEFQRTTKKMSSWWPVLQTDFQDLEGEKNSPLPDVRPWFDSSLVLSPRAYRLLGDALKQCGELLPVQAEGDTYYIFNCLTVGEDDKDNCSFKQVEGIDFELERLTFKDSNAKHFIFKSEMDSYRNLFCTDRFKNAVEEFGLTGISFDESLIDPVPEGLVY